MLPRYLSNILLVLSTSVSATNFFSLICRFLFKVFLCKCCQSLQNFLKPQSHNSSSFVFVFVDVSHDSFFNVFILFKFTLSSNWFCSSSYTAFPSLTFIRLSNDLSQRNLIVLSLNVWAVSVKIFHMSSHASFILFINPQS